MMEVLLALGVVWSITFVMSYIARSAEASNAMKLQQRIELARKKRIDQLYGRD